MRRPERPVDVDEAVDGVGRRAASEGRERGRSRRSKIGLSMPSNKLYLLENTVESRPRHVGLGDQLFDADGPDAALREPPRADCEQRGPHPLAAALHSGTDRERSAMALGAAVSRRNHTRASVLERRYLGAAARVHLDRGVDDVEPCRQQGLVVVRRLRRGRTTVTSTEYRFRPMHQTCKSTTRLPSTRSMPSRTAAQISGAALRSSSTALVARSNPNDQRATSTAPTMPMNGSIHLSPKYLAASKRNDRQHRRQRVGKHVQIGRG